MVVERTRNPFATYGPNGDGGESWAEYFRRVKQVRGAEPSDPESEPEPDDPVRAQRVSAQRRGDVGELVDPPNPLVAYRNLLIKRGFDTREGWYTIIYEGGVFGPSAEKAGQEIPLREVTTAWLVGYKPGRLVKINYERVTGVGGDKWTCSWRQVNKEYRKVSDKELKDWINDVVEGVSSEAGATVGDDDTQVDATPDTPTSD